MTVRSAWLVILPTAGGGQGDEDQIEATTREDCGVRKSLPLVEDERLNGELARVFSLG